MQQQKVLIDGDEERFYVTTVYMKAGRSMEKYMPTVCTVVFLQFHCQKASCAMTGGRSGAAGAPFTCMHVQSCWCGAAWTGGVISIYGAAFCLTCCPLAWLTKVLCLSD